MLALSASPAARLARLRRIASAHGLIIRTSRRSADEGGMMLVDLAGNFLVAAGGYSLDLDGITLWFTSLTASG